MSPIPSILRITGSIRYTVGQHLLRDRGKFINTRQIIVGQNNEKLSEIQFETQITNLIVTAQKTYWDLVFAAEDLKVKTAFARTRSANAVRRTRPRCRSECSRLSK